MTLSELDEQILGRVKSVRKGLEDLHSISLMLRSGVQATFNIHRVGLDQAFEIWSKTADTQYNSQFQLYRKLKRGIHSSLAITKVRSGLADAVSYFVSRLASTQVLTEVTEKARKAIDEASDEVGRIVEKNLDDLTDEEQAFIEWVDEIRPNVIDRNGFSDPIRRAMGDNWNRELAVLDQIRWDYDDDEENVGRQEQRTIGGRQRAEQESVNETTMLTASTAADSFANPGSNLHDLEMLLSNPELNTTSLDLEIFTKLRLELQKRELIQKIDELWENRVEIVDRASERLEALKNVGVNVVMHELNHLFRDISFNVDRRFQIVARKMLRSVSTNPRITTDKNLAERMINSLTGWICLKPKNREIIEDQLPPFLAEKMNMSMKEVHSILHRLDPRELALMSLLYSPATNITNPSEWFTKDLRKNERQQIRAERSPREPIRFVFNQQQQQQFSRETEQFEESMNTLNEIESRLLSGQQQQQQQEQQQQQPINQRKGFSILATRIAHVAISNVTYLNILNLLAVIVDELIVRAREGTALPAWSLVAEEFLAFCRPRLCVMIYVHCLNSASRDILEIQLTDALTVRTYQRRWEPVGSKSLVTDVIIKSDNEMSTDLFTRVWNKEVGNKYVTAENAMNPATHLREISLWLEKQIGAIECELEKRNAETGNLDWENKVLEMCKSVGVDNALVDGFREVQHLIRKAGNASVQIVPLHSSLISLHSVCEADEERILLKWGKEGQAWFDLVGHITFRLDMKERECLFKLQEKNSAELSVDEKWVLREFTLCHECVFGEGMVVGQTFIQVPCSLVPHICLSMKHELEEQQSKWMDSNEEAISRAKLSMTMTNGRMGVNVRANFRNVKFNKASNKTNQVVLNQQPQQPSSEIDVE